MAGSMQQSNFTHLRAHDEQLVRLGLLAERYFAEDPNTCLLKLRQSTRALGQGRSGTFAHDAGRPGRCEADDPDVVEGWGAVAAPETPAGPGS